MSDIKFHCPSCNQKIQVDATAAGRRINCPGCQAKIQIPAAEAKPDARSTPAAVKATKPIAASAPPAVPASPQIAAPPPKPSSTSASVQPQAARSTAEAGATAPVPTSQAPANPAPKPGTVVIPKAPAPSVRPPAAAASVQSTVAPADTPGSQSRQPQVARLTPALKREIIRSVRRRIADEAHWMPRITPAGEYAYAAKDVDGKTASVQPTDPEATRFSVLGALLLEFHERNVTRTAAGRQELLDQELLDALRQVVGDEACEQELAPGELPSSGKQVPPVSHAQSLEALDLLEARYAGEAEESAAATHARTDEIRLADLTRKLDRKRPVTMAEVCAALSNELKMIHERLDALEKPHNKGGAS